MTKTLATWSAGNGGGCVPAALLPLVADTKYYVISMLNSTGAVDFAIDTDEAGTNALADPAIQAWDATGGGNLG
jgi:hypothetical protein